MSLLIKNGKVVTAVDCYEADVFAADETVTLIGKDLEVQADQVVDAAGKLVIPGGIDPHTHLDMPFGGTMSADDFETGTRAAAHGGTTTIIDFAIQTRGQSALAGLDTWHAKAEGKTAIDYGFHMIVTDVEGERLDELDRLAGEGVTSYKLFTAYPGVLYVDDGTLYQAMRKAGEAGSIVCMHAENGIVIDQVVAQCIAEGKTAPRWHGHARLARMEGEATHRAISIAEVAEVPIYIVHLTCRESLEHVTRARGRGQAAYAETCPQYLFLDVSYYDREGFEGAKWVMSPPLREKSNQEDLWRGLSMGDLQVVSTDHCPFNFEGQKDMGREAFTKIPNGAPGIENRMSLVYNGGVVGGRISANRFVEITSTSAAKLFGLFPRKGTIAVGSDADIVVFDPERRETISVNNPVMHNMNVDYSSFEGVEVQGIAETVISRGRVIVRDCQYVGEKGQGQYLKRGPCGTP